MKRPQVEVERALAPHRAARRLVFGSADDIRAAQLYPGETHERIARFFAGAERKAV